MKFGKLTAAVASAAVAASMMAVNAFAADTITLDSDYAGNWGAGACIPQADLLAVGGDVKITLDIETIAPQGEDQFLVTPMDFGAPGWPRITNKCTTLAGVSKSDQFITLVDGETSVEFVVPADVIENLTENDDGEIGIGFQVCNVIVKSATLEKGEPESEFRIIENDNVIPYCFGEYEMPAEELSADTASADNSASDASETSSDSDSPKTGNRSVAVAASVMIISGAAAIATKKRK